MFSSFSIYGWNERDRPYEALFEECIRHPAITYHGAKSNAEVREALKESHIFAFPSIWPETSCLAMIEAMASGTHVVHSNLGALPETSGGATTCYPFVTDRDQHADIFYDALDKVIVDYAGGAWGHNKTCIAQTLAAVNHDVKDYVKQWVTLLDSIK